MFFSVHCSISRIHSPLHKKRTECLSFLFCLTLASCLFDASHSLQVPYRIDETEGEGRKVSLLNMIKVEGCGRRRRKRARRVYDVSPATGNVYTLSGSGVIKCRISYTPPLCSTLAMEGTGGGGDGAAAGGALAFVSGREGEKIERGRTGEKYLLLGGIWCTFSLVMQVVLCVWTNSKQNPRVRECVCLMGHPRICFLFIGGCLAGVFWEVEEGRGTTAFPGEKLRGRRREGMASNGRQVG